MIIILFFHNCKYIIYGMILDKYIRKQLFSSFISVGLILVGIAWMIQILLLMKLIIRHGIEVQGFIGMSFYTFPMLIGMITPFIAFIAATSVYGKIIGTGEVSVMFANGMSPARIARPAIFFGIIVTILHIFMNLSVIPTTQDKFYAMQWSLRYGLGHLRLREATFNKMMDHVVIYVEEIRDSDMRGLMIRDGRGGEERIITATYGQMVSTLNGMSIVMGPGGFQARGAIGNAVGTFSGAEMDMGLGDAEDARGRNPRRLSTGELLELIKNFGAQPRWLQTRAASEAANRFLSPLMNIMLVLVSLVFLLKTSTLRRRRSFASAYASTVMLLLMTAFMSLSAGAGGVLLIYRMLGGILAIILGLLWYLRK